MAGGGVRLRAHAPARVPCPGLSAPGDLATARASSQSQATCGVTAQPGPRARLPRSSVCNVSQRGRGLGAGRGGVAIGPAPPRARRKGTTRRRPVASPRPPPRGLGGGWSDGRTDSWMNHGGRGESARAVLPPARPVRDCTCPRPGLHVPLSGTARPPVRDCKSPCPGLHVPLSGTVRTLSGTARLSCRCILPFEAALNPLIKKIAE